MYKILVYLHIIHLLKSSTCFDHYPANRRRSPEDEQGNAQNM